MTDEKYTFIKDVSEKKRIAKSGGKKGKSRYGCKLPSDNLGTKEKRALNSVRIDIGMNCPVSYEKFLKFSEDIQKEYLQNLIDNFGGTTGRIAKMFSCTEAKVKEFRVKLGINSVRIPSPEDETKWEMFLKAGEFLRKPMNWSVFSHLDTIDQEDYLNWLRSTFNVSNPKIEQMFGISYNSLLQYVRRHNLILKKRTSTYKSMTKEELFKWNEFLGPEFAEEAEPIAKRNPKSEVTVDEEKVEEAPIPEVHNEPVPESITNTNYGLNNFSMEWTIQNLDQAEEILHVFNTVRSFNLKEGTIIFHIKEV